MKKLSQKNFERIFIAGLILGYALAILAMCLAYKFFERIF